MCVLFCFSSVCLHVCAYASKFKVYCGSTFEPGASGLPYYCTPPMCVPHVIGALAVWRQSKKKCMCVCLQVQGSLRECLRVSASTSAMCQRALLQPSSALFPCEFAAYVRALVPSPVPAGTTQHGSRLGESAPHASRAIRHLQHINRGYLLLKAKKVRS